MKFVGGMEESLWRSRFKKKTGRWTRACERSVPVAFVSKLRRGTMEVPHGRARKVRGMRTEYLANKGCVAAALGVVLVRRCGAVRC